MGRLFFRFLLLCFPLSIPFIVFADIRIISILPNPVGDDSMAEYIEIRNTGCSERDVGGFSLHDVSGRSPYFFPTGTIIRPKESKKIIAPELTISLNNSGDESVILRGTGGDALQTVEYSGTQKDGIIIDLAYEDADCPNTNSNGSQSSSGSESSATGSSSSGSTSTGTLDNSRSGTENTGSGGNSGTGNTSSSGSSTSSGSSQSIGSGSNNNSGSGDTTSGSIGSGATFSGKLLAKSLGYLDSDLDGYIDTIFLDYDETLSGSINTGNIALYSNTGGLYESRVNTETGYIQGATLSGKSIFLNILPATQKKLLLKINNTTTSELRLKSSGNLGVTTLSGQELESIFLTSSFGEYRNIIHPTITNNEKGTTNSNTGTTDTGSTATGKIFPDVFFTFQNYTNTTLSGNTFICSVSPCRLNFTLEPIFTGSFLERDYTCRIEYGGEIYETCNPSQIYPTASFTGILIHIIRKTDQKVQELSYIFAFENGQNGSTQTPVPKIADTNPPIVIIDFDGKKKAYYEQIGDYEYNCYTDTCSVNLTAERSYDGEGGKVRFMWLYNMTNLSESKDPGERKFGFGKHDIWLRVIDEAGNWSQVHYLVHVLGKKEGDKEKKEEKIKIEKSPSKKKKTEKTNTITKQKKKEKTQAIDFFDPPKIILQNTNARENNGAYICKTNKKECSINFSLSGTEKGITYAWSYGTGQQIVSINPRSYGFHPGDHIVILTASYGTGTPIWSQNIPVQVIQEKKTKKKSLKNKTKIISKKIEKKVIPDGIPEIKNQKQEYSIVGALFLIGFGGIYWRKRRKISISSR